MPKVGRDRVLGPLDRLLRSGSAVGLSDTQLLERFANRHDEAAEAAFAAIIERHGPMVFSICRRQLPCPEDANDAFQATFLILVRQAGAVRRRDSLASWLHGVAIRVSARSRAASARRGVVERQTAEQAAIAAADPPRDDLSEIWREVDRLPRLLHSAVMLCYFEGLSHEQAAARLGWPVGTIRSRLARARDRLRTRLARQGYDPASPLAGLTLLRPIIGSLPASLVEPTARAAMLVAARDAFEAGLVSASVLSLTEGVLRVMFFTKIKLTAAVMVGLLVASAGAYAYQTPGSGGEPAAWKAVDPTRETVSALKLEGEYRLSRVEDPIGTEVTKLRITAFDDRKFVVRGVDQDWVGEGEVADNQGYYRWKFDNGQTGRTDFAVQPDGSITGRVLGSGHDWRYLARPTRLNFKPATALEAVAADPVAPLPRAGTTKSQALPKSAVIDLRTKEILPRTDTQTRLDNIEQKLEAVLEALKSQSSEPKADQPSDQQPDRMKRGELPW